MPEAARHRSSAAPLALAFALLIGYASLYPFTGWRWPPGQALESLLVLPRSPIRMRLAFDEVSNLLGYMPLGALLYGAVVRSGARGRAALLAALLIPALLSYACEVVQHFVPGRVPSVRDWLLNVGGAALGAVIAALLHARGLLDRWQLMRDRWFVSRSAGALALLVLWPLALLYPAPLPLGLGQWWGEVRSWVEAALVDTPWEDAAQAALRAESPSLEPLPPLQEALAVALGFLAPCLVAYAASRPGWRRLLLAFGAFLLGLSATTLSTALNFGPEHALAWLTPVTLPALSVGGLAAVLCALLPRRVAAGLGLIALTGLVALVSQAPADAYYAASLQSWEQGRFIRFHGLARWLGWVWPYAAMGWLLLQLGARERGLVDGPR